MQLNVREWGDPAGAPVVCLHGLTGHGRRYRHLAEDRLSAFRVVGVDYRGHGDSTWAPPWGVEQHVTDLIETTDALGIPSAAWIGHSFGGRLVAELAARHPDRVERAVLLDPAMHVDPALAAERAGLACGDLSFGSTDEAIDARLSDGSLFTTPRETLEQEAQDHLVEGEDGRFRWRWSAPAAIVAWSEMAMPSPPWPRCPTLVVTGARSWLPVTVPARGTIAHVVMPGGHGPLWDDYDATAEAIAGFLG